MFFYYNQLKIDYKCQKKKGDIFNASLKLNFVDKVPFIKMFFNICLVWNQEPYLHFVASGFVFAVY